MPEKERKHKAAGPGFSERIERAISLAAKAHDGQYRKSDEGLPYIVHPITVGFTLAQHGFPEHVVLAGILHDTVEDTTTTLEEVRAEFGVEVAELVSLMTMTDSRGLHYRERKERQAEKLTGAPPDVRAIKAVDLLHNLFSLVEAARRGDALAKHFDHGKAETLWGYRLVISAISDGWSHPLLGELDRYLREYEALS